MKTAKILFLTFIVSGLLWAFLALRQRPIESATSDEKTQVQKNLLHSAQSAHMFAQPLIQSKSPTPSAQTSADPSVVPPVDQKIATLTALQKVYAPSAKKVAAMEAILNDVEFMQSIRSALDDPKAFSGKKFHRKLRLLDALYAGLQSDDVKTKSNYIELVEKILRQELPFELATNRPDRRYLSDRVEIALVVLKAFPELSKSIRSKTSATGQEAFREATTIVSLYNVAI